MGNSVRIALLDPDADVRSGRRMIVSSQSNFEVVLDSDGQDSDVSAVANGLVDIIILDQRLASGPGVLFYETLRSKVGIKQAPNCVLTAAFNQTALQVLALEVGINQVVFLEQGAESLLRAIREGVEGKSPLSLSQLRSLVLSEEPKVQLDVEFMRQVTKLPEKLASKLRRLRTLWKKGAQQQLSGYVLEDLDAVVGRLPVRNAEELIIRLYRSGFMNDE
jgi:DNA-binding NarL/FixJ family response regulator